MNNINNNPSQYQSETLFSIQFQRFYSDAKAIANNEILLQPLLSDVILSRSTFGEAIANLLASSFESNFISRSTWYKIFLPVFQGEYGKYEGESIISLLVQDILAVEERDPAVTNLVQVFMHLKGFKALQAHRAAHILWHSSRKDIAVAIQSKVSELWSVDIHPAARIGAGLMMDHATGVVIGETALVGRNCSFLHGVTLGSTGKDVGDRHPKIGDDVLIGCNAIVLGNITIGQSSKIGSGSVVIKSIPAYVTAVGNPARIIGQSSDKVSAARGMDLALANVICPDGQQFNCTWSSWADGTVTFDDIDMDGKGCITKDDLRRLFHSKFGHNVPDECLDMVFPILDSNHDGVVCRTDFDLNFSRLQPILKTDFFKSMATKKRPSSPGKHRMKHVIAEPYPAPITVPVSMITPSFTDMHEDMVSSTSGSDNEDGSPRYDHSEMDVGKMVMEYILKLNETSMVSEYGGI